MWNNILSVVKNIDIASFLCEETCRYCGQAVPFQRKKWSESREPSERNGLHKSNESREPSERTGLHKSSESREPCERNGLHKSSESREPSERNGLHKSSESREPCERNGLNLSSQSSLPRALKRSDGGSWERRLPAGFDSPSERLPLSIAKQSRNEIDMSLVLETSKSSVIHPQFKTGPPATCLCPKCSELMWLNRQSVWSLPIIDHKQSPATAGGDGTTSGTTRLLTVATAGMYEGPMQKLIRRLKYDDDRLVVADIGPMLTRAYEMLLTAMPELLDDKDDIFLVPVPLHSTRQRRRGYNQAELIAKEFAKLTNLRVHNKVLIRKRKTRPQYGLGRQDRLSNIDGAFEIGRNDIRNKTVIIVDDVFTSGATLTSCAALLTECGAKQVAAMAAARAPYDKRGR